MKNRTAACSACKNVSYCTPKNKLAHEWCNTEPGVSAKYSDRLEQLAWLKPKIHKHNNSEIQRAYQKIKQKSVAKMSGVVSESLRKDKTKLSFQNHFQYCSEIQIIHRPGTWHWMKWSPIKIWSTFTKVIFTYGVSHREQNEKGSGEKHYIKT
jgi:hypothetical protein